MIVTKVDGNYIISVPEDYVYDHSIQELPEGTYHFLGLEPEALFCLFDKFSDLEV